MVRRFTWLLLVALLLTPLLGALSPRAAHAEDGVSTEITVPAADGTPTADDGTPVDPATEEPTEVPTETETATPSETPTDVPAETETAVPSETATVEPSATGTPADAATPAVEAAGNAGAASDLVITVKCNTTPETVRVTNSGSGDITLTGLTSLVDQLPSEPFALNRTLKAGQTAIFQTGSGAQYGTVLTPRFIFTNSAYDAEGVTITTNTGDATQKCDAKPAPVDPVVANPGKLSDLSVTLSCRTYAETVRVTNNGSGYILLKALATYYAPLGDEPYRLDRVLKPGATAIYQAGTGAQYGTVLTKQYIFTNEVWDKDGVRISTSAGKAFKSCEAKPVPPERWVEVDLSSQYLWAWEGNKLVNQTYVSTGKAGFETPTGTFYINSKYLTDDMAGSAGGETWYVPDVPWTMYFTYWGHALHGTYWHNNFGTPMSHGCVNLPLPFAEWLYYWLPYGGRVVIHW